MFTPTHSSVARSITVLIADDHPPIRHIVYRFLAGEPDIQVVGEAGTGAAAKELVHTLNPDVLLLDHVLPDLPTLSLLEQIPSTCRALVYTGHTCPQLAELLLRAGVNGFMTKTDDCALLAHAVRQVARGQIYISACVAANLALTRTVGSALDAASEALGVRDFDVLRQLANGLSTAEVAKQLTISERNVRQHIEKICAILGLKHRYDLAAWAAANAFGDPRIE